MSIEDRRLARLADFMQDASPLLIGSDAHDIADDARHQTVLAVHQLQYVQDYRGALQRWFDTVALGGHLIIVVHHAFLHERQLALPSRRTPPARRLYTPEALLLEVEEALVPNSYRVRLLCDHDAGYNYDSPNPDADIGGAQEILLVIERIATPAWGLDETAEAAAPGPDYGFEPPHTREETAMLIPRQRILILKLDHLGDFIMGLPALHKARAKFADAQITLVVGSWNLQLARDSGVADEVIAFDVFPRNSTEEGVDLVGKTALFETAILGAYDLAIDLRTDPDTRFLLKSVRAPVRAGIGTRAQFPFLDIFLPIDISRHEPEVARDDIFKPDVFASQPFCKRSAFRIACEAKDARGDRGALVWGPYIALRPGRYFFEPFVEFDSQGCEMLLADVALDKERVVALAMPGPAPLRLAFTVEKPGAEFEFRLHTPSSGSAAGFSFYGGRLVREGGGSVLHQSEYAMLLIELIAMRTDHGGLLRDQRSLE